MEEKVALMMCDRCDGGQSYEMGHTSCVVVVGQVWVVGGSSHWMVREGAMTRVRVCSLGVVGNGGVQQRWWWLKVATGQAGRWCEEWLAVKGVKVWNRLSEIEGVRMGQGGTSGKENEGSGQ
ncbi:unnamed protein product [Sphenostylis stenocarpa]|uniref:Uncharacterized protein n=1 Tax=Sphenostylis stenocarpa TaxID=92480 RepID=A0AA86VDU8_9FABA|nr:unnamed protein product [Sphenostylis stenocarpa]